MPDDDIGYITFSHPVAVVYLDACHRDDGFHPGSVTTVDGLVAALTEQRGWAERRRTRRTSPSTATAARHSNAPPPP